MRLANHVLGDDVCEDVLSVVTDGHVQSRMRARAAAGVEDERGFGPRLRIKRRERELLPGRSERVQRLVGCFFHRPPVASQRGQSRHDGVRTARPGIASKMALTRKRLVQMG